MTTSFAVARATPNARQATVAHAYGRGLQRDVRSVSGRCRPDILLPHWQGGGPCAIDVSIVHPLAPSTPCCAVKNGSKAVDAMERVKHSKYGQCCNESNVSFIPFVLSTFGLFGAEAERVFHGVTAAARRRAVVDDSNMWASYLQKT